MKPTTVTEVVLDTFLVVANWREHILPTITITIKAVILVGMTFPDCANKIIQCPSSVDEGVVAIIRSLELSFI